jgi:hypothetical protein
MYEVGVPIIKKVEPVIDYCVQTLCLNPYEGHPHGCPNYGKKAGCPPCLLYDDVHDTSLGVYAIINVYNYKGFIDRMREAHPLWSDRQVKCVLRWQGSARKQLRLAINEFKSIYGGEYNINTCPEGLGVNVSETLKAVGVEIYPIIDVTYQVALAGMLRR